MKYAHLLPLLIFCSCSSEPAPVTEDDFVLLEDLLHSRKQNTSITGSFDRLGYDDSHGYASFKMYIEQLGMKHRKVSAGTIDAETLDNVDILFINLTDSKMNKFSSSEVDAIDTFVDEGGGLFIIVDHTNAYYSSDWIAPVLELFDLSVSFHTAMDVRDETLKQNHWLLIPEERTADHPIMAQIRHHAYLASGPILGPGSVAWTTDDGWWDTWDESKPPSFWGNFQKDEDEPTTSSSIMNALEYGEGRVVVAGDQNMFGNSYLGFADNRQVLANVIQWLGKKEAEEPFRDVRFDRPSMVIDFRTRDWNDWWTSGFSPLYSSMARQNDFFPEVALDTPSYTPEVLLLPEPETIVDDEDLAHPKTVLENGGQVYLFIDPADPTTAALDLLAELWPEFELPEVEATEFAGSQFAGLETREMEVTGEVVDLGDVTGDPVMWLERGDERSDLVVKKDGLHVVVQPDVFHFGDYIYANESLFRYMAEQFSP